MKIVYHCYGGSHSSVTAAAIHLGYLPEDRIPSYREIIQIPLYDKQNSSDHGRFFLLGIDEYKNEVYVIGCRSLGDICKNILQSVGKIVGINSEKVIFINTLKAVNFRMRIGGYLSRKLGFINLGRPLVLNGTRSNYNKFVEIVRSVKLYLSK